MKRASQSVERLDSIRIGFIGAGKVGFSLGRLLSDKGYPISGYVSRTLESAREAARFTESRCFETREELVAASDAIFVTVPDRAITEVYLELLNCDISGKQICHCSGSLSAEEAFPKIHEAGAYGYSIHPLFPVNDRYTSYRELPRAVFCIEGDQEHLGDWKARLESTGATVQEISGKSKKLYHAACCVSSNLMCALVQQSIDMLRACGFEEDAARSAIAPLMSANLEHIIEVGPIQALTGPIERNDAETVSAHLESLVEDSERELYRIASLKLVDVARARHPQDDYSKIYETLGESVKGDEQ